RIPDNGRTVDKTESSGEFLRSCILEARRGRAPSQFQISSLRVRNRPRGRTAARLEVAQDRQGIPVHSQDIAAPVLASLVVQVKLRSFPVRSRLKSVDITGRGDGCIVIESVNGFNRTTLKSEVASVRIRAQPRTSRVRSHVFPRHRAVF